MEERRIEMRSIKYFSLTALLIVFFSANILAQKKKGARIQYRANTVEVDKSIGKGAQRLLDDVEFKHSGAKMYCDSAYFYSKQNSLDAFDNIFINQGDTVFIYGDFLHYDGNTKLATITGNVKLINDETTLTTDKLDYELNSAIAYYTDSATTVNKENILKSKEGYYYTRKKIAIFHKSVKITNPDYIMTSDSVEYHTKSGIARFFGPTDIVGDSSHIFGEYGWYDTELDKAELKTNAWIQNKKQTIFGDYIYYDKLSGDGLARKNVKILEEEKNVLLLGNQAIYNDLTEYAFLTDSAQFIQFTSEGDSLFLHADSLISYPDTSGQKIIFAYYNAKFYRNNVQGICDSLVYSFVDSTVRMYHDPILWTGKNQISAETIEILTKNQKIEKMNLYKSSFITSQEEIEYFNQIKGKNMFCFFKNNELYQIDVVGNGRTVYFPKDEGQIMGANVSECSNIKIFLEGSEVNRINFYVKPTGGMYPLEKAPENKLKLKGFKWHADKRPNDRYDIF